jgi:hypothetical protein
MTARLPDKSRTNRDGQRPNLTTIPRGKPTLPPLPSLQEPLYVIPDRRGPKRVRESELSDLKGASPTDSRFAPLIRDLLICTSR